MSTKFTQRKTPMVESQTLQLSTQARLLNDVLVRYVTQQLVDKGYESITPSLLSFLSILECGVNHGSEIARDLGVSRQMVAKTVKELCRLSYLEQVDGTGKQKDILFTEEGEHLISDARQLLYDVDGELCQHLGDKNIADIIEQLSSITNLVDKKMNSS